MKPFSIKRNFLLSSYEIQDTPQEGPSLALIYMASFKRMEDLKNQKYRRQINLQDLDEVENQIMEETLLSSSKSIEIKTVNTKKNFQIEREEGNDQDKRIPFLEMEKELTSPPQLDKIKFDFINITHSESTPRKDNMASQIPKLMQKSLSSITQSQKEQNSTKDIAQKSFEVQEMAAILPKLPFKYDENNNINFFEQKDEKNTNENSLTKKEQSNKFNFQMHQNQINDDRNEPLIIQIPQTSKEEEISNIFNPRGILINKQVVSSDQRLQLFERSEEENSNKISFKWKFLLEFLGYHFLYMFVFGPLTPIIFIYIFKQNAAVWQNMEFYGISRMNLVQIGIYFSYMLGLFILFNLSENLSIQYRFYFFTFFYSYVIKCITDSLKYGFFTWDQMKNVKSKLLNDNQLKKQFIFGMWLQQSDDIIAEEIEAAIKRLEIESTSFFFEFMTAPPKEKMLPLISKIYNLSNQNIKSYLNTSQIPFGQNLITEYIKFYREKYKMSSIKTIPFMISIIRQAYFLCLKIMDVLHHIEDTSQKCLIISSYILNGFLEIMFWASIVMYLLVYFQDLHRKAFILNQMSHLISPKKVDISLDSNKKLYPTLALVCPISLRTWANLRRITLEYGEKYSQRIQVMLSILAPFFISIIVICILQTLSIINLYLPMEVTYLYAFDISVFTTISIKCISMGGKINEQFNQHIQKLYMNKLIFTELLSKFDLWFQEDFVLRNTLFRTLIEQYMKMKERMGFSTNQLRSFIQDTIHISSMHILDIQIQKNDNPYKVFGVAMTQKLALTIFTALISLIFSLSAQHIYSSNYLSSSYFNN